MTSRISQVAKSLSLLVLLALTLNSAGVAQDSAAATSTFFAEFQAFEAQVGDRMIALAKAIPAERYTWRPASGVRSVSEVLMHIAAANFGSAKAVGAPMPADLPQDLSKVTRKDEVLALLESSYRLARGAAKNLATMDLSQPLPGGSGMSLRASLFGFVEHQAEHLGQLIAYARGLGVTPPWSR